MKTMPLQGNEPFVPLQSSHPDVPVLPSSNYFVSPAFTPLPLGAVKPTGWLRDWCEDAAAGITGHADELDPVFAKGWMESEIKVDGPANMMQAGDGKQGYALEQAGYWIDGAVRLGHLLEDQALLAKCCIRFEGILRRVEAGLPPMPVNQDLWEKGEKWAHWPMVVMGRALLAEYSATCDPRYLTALEKIYADYAKFNSDGQTFSLITHQGRQVMNTEVMFEAFRAGGNSGLRGDAVEVLRSQSDEIMTRLGWHEHDLVQGATDPHFHEVPHGHAVTFNESAKIPGIGYLYTGEADWLRFSELSFEDMEKHEMLPYGLTSAHEQPSGVGPFATTELCNAIDYTWSNIWMMRITGHSVYGDRIERTMFNAAPGGIAPDFRSHAYFISPNRIDLAHPPKPGVGGGPNFAPKHFPLCCTANVSRLVPNYVMHLWMASSDGGLAATLYGPSDTKTTVADTLIALNTRTDYPFGDEIVITVTPEHPVTFPLHLRVPQWCEQPMLALNGAGQPVGVANGFITLNREWKRGDVIRLTLPRQPRITTGICADGAPYASVNYGPLLFALPIPTLGGDLNVPQPDVEWRFALDPASAPQIKVTREPMPKRWSWHETSAPLRLTVDAVHAPFGADFELPRRFVPDEAGKSEELHLLPFGSTAFRVSMFAVVADSCS